MTRGRGQVSVHCIYCMNICLQSFHVLYIKKQCLCRIIKQHPKLCSSDGLFCFWKCEKTVKFFAGTALCALLFILLTVKNEFELNIGRKKTMKLANIHWVKLIFGKSQTTQTPTAARRTLNNRKEEQHVWSEKVFKDILYAEPGSVPESWVLVAQNQVDCKSSIHFLPFIQAYRLALGENQGVPGQRYNLFSTSQAWFLWSTYWLWYTKATLVDMRARQNLHISTGVEQRSQTFSAPQMV